MSAAYACLGQARELEVLQIFIDPEGGAAPGRPAMVLSFRCFKDYSDDAHQRIEALLEAARRRQLTVQQKRSSVVLGFWGFAAKDRCDALVQSLCRAFRIFRVFCSDVGENRFEGIMCIYSVHLPALNKLVEEVRMSMGLLELGGVRAGGCLRCRWEETLPGVLACVKRVEGGSSKRGVHPVSWGENFRRFMMESQARDSVLQVTGMALDANNMIMLFMSREASEQTQRRTTARASALTRERDEAVQRADMLQRENNRMLYETQLAFRTGSLRREAFHLIMFGELNRP